MPEAETPAPDVKVTKKGKAAAKKGKGATQWDILKNSGIPEDEIPNFQCAARSSRHAITEVMQLTVMALTEQDQSVMISTD